MCNTYWVEEWAKLRQDEMVRLPENLDINEIYLKQLQESDFVTAFREIWDLFIRMYGDVSKAPEAFGMPLFKREEYTGFTPQARESRKAPYRPFQVLYHLLVSGEQREGYLITDVKTFKTGNDVKNTPLLLEKLKDYGFVIEGVKNAKIIKPELILSYPDNVNVITVLRLMAEKAEKTDRQKDFLSCHYKLFKDNMDTADYGFGADRVADKMHTGEEQDFIYKMDEALTEKGYFAGRIDWNEGPGYAYYSKESQLKSRGPYEYKLLSWKTKLVLYLRIRNASRCLSYLEECPDSVKQIFLWSDNGCKNRLTGKCTYGQEYTIDEKTYWRCGCCNAPFHFYPVKEDIPYYIKLIELGCKK